MAKKETEFLIQINVLKNGSKSGTYEIKLTVTDGDGIDGQTIADKAASSILTSLQEAKK